MRGNSFYGAPLYIFRASPDRRFDAGQARYLINSLLALGPVAFQVVARPQGIRWQVLDLSGRRSALSTLKTPQVAVKAVRYGSGQSKAYPFYRAKLSYTTSHIAENPLLYVEDCRAESDPLLPLAQSMSYLHEGEEVRYTVLVERSHKPLWYQGMAVADDILHGDPFERHLNTYQQVIRHKRNQPWYTSVVALDVDSPDAWRADELRQTLDFQLSGAFDRYQPNHPPNGLRARGYPRLVTIHDRTTDHRTTMIGWYARGQMDEKVADWWADHWLYLTVSELGSLWHLPHKNFADTTVWWAETQPALPRPVARNPEGVVLGQGIYQDERVAARLHPRDRDTHSVVVGRTGGGKSTWLHQQIHQDIANGEGVFVVDPHGPLVSSILQCSIPPEREDDVVVLDLKQTDYPIPLNLFAGAQTYAAVGRVVDIIERVHSSSGVQIDKFLRAGIRALQHQPQATMMDMFLLFTDAPYREKILSQVTDRSTYHTLYEDYDRTGPGVQRKIHGPVFNRISPFYANPTLYPSLCHPHRIPLGDWIDTQKIVLVSLETNSEKVPGNERNLVGALLISLLQMVGMRPGRPAVPCYIYIDEVQYFVTSALETVFSEARKYNLSMTVAHQHFGQLSPEVLQGILGNVGTIITFPTNTEDANKLAPHLQPQFTSSDLVKLNRFQAAVKMQYQGESQDAFLIHGEPPLPVPPDGALREQLIRLRSIEQYTPLSRKAVMDWLQTRYPDPIYAEAVDTSKKAAEDVAVNDVTTDDLDYEEFTG